MAQLFKKIIKTTSFLLILILSTGSVSAQKSKKKSTKSTATKTKTTTTSTTTSTKTTTKVEKKTLETKLSEEEQKKQDISTGKKLASAIKSDTQKSHSVSGIILKRYISSEEGKFGADILEITGDANIELTSINTILETYIAETFEYSPEDADTLASFIVSFNTKNRNNQDYLIKNFSTNVVLGAKKEKIGLPAVATVESINGQSQVLIPIERNILKKYALDVASLELLDQTKSDLVLQKNGDAQKAKFETFLNKKATSENEELNNRLMTANPAEIKGITDRLALNKKREEMRKANFTSEKEYVAFLDSKNKKETTTVSETTKSNVSGTVVNSALPSGPVVPSDKFTTYIAGGNHPGINAREFLFIPGSGILAIGYDASKAEKKDLQLFMTSTGDYELKRSSEGIKLAAESPMVYSNGKVYVIEMLKKDAFIAQFNTELEFEMRSEATINEKSVIQVVGDEVIVTAIDKKGTPDDTRIFKVKDLSFVK
ncbi:MAG: hypothetical protein KBA66_18095 [Leptospiraceae bacterium]|nr:hypothetical protein [Leptospiraceae bacterium]